MSCIVFRLLQLSTSYQVEVSKGIKLVAWFGLTTTMGRGKGATTAEQMFLCTRSAAPDPTSSGVEHSEYWRDLIKLVVKDVDYSE
jgi:hypothetical protein